MYILRLRYNVSDYKFKGRQVAGMGVDKSTVELSFTNTCFIWTVLFVPIKAHLFSLQFSCLIWRLYVYLYV